MKNNPVKLKPNKDGRYDFTFTMKSLDKLKPQALEDSKLSKLVSIYDHTGIRFDEVIVKELKKSNQYKIKGSFHSDLKDGSVGDLFNRFLADLSAHYEISETSYNKESGRVKDDEYFNIFAIVFNVTKAKRFLPTHEQDTFTPNEGWSNFVHVDEKHYPTVDLSLPCIFGTIILDDKKAHYLIDGHHRNKKALEEKVKELPCIVLSVAETFSLITYGHGTKLYNDMRTYIKTNKD